MGTLAEYPVSSILFFVRSDMSRSETVQPPRAHLTALAYVAVALLGAGIIAASADEVGQDSVATKAASGAPHQYVYIVYLNPADRRECQPGYQERLDRVMTEIQSWYRDEMARNGFGPMTFPLERDEDGELVIHVVQGNRSYPYGEKPTTTEIRDNQVKRLMAERGIDIDREHIIIFQNLTFGSEKDGDTVLHSWAPYCGGGTHKSGTAWVTDFPFLDPLNLPKKSPRVLDDGKRPYTMGRYMMTYLGGVAHEFGHALGLPHNEQTAEQFEELGYTLMGSGNYHLFAERAGEGKGSYLSKPHATILSSHPLFKRNTKDIDVEADCKFADIEFTAGDDEYIVTGHVESTPAAYAVVAYHDLMRHHTDYDATSWVAPVDSAGRFEVHVGALERGWYELRLRFYLVNGDKTELKYRFTLDQSLEIPADKLKRQTLYELYAKPAIEARDPEALLAAIRKLGGFNDVYYRRAKACHRLMTRKETEQQELSALSEDVRQVPLASVTWASAEVGWEKPACDYVPGAQMPLESGEQFHETGLYAHANSSYVYDLGGNWKRFTSAYGLQNLDEGSVVFVVKCDGKEMFRSELIKDWVEGRVEVDLSGVNKLELIVEDGDNGKWADCGIWFSPMLRR
jgi:hypothetical protein